MSLSGSAIETRAVWLSFGDTHALRGVDLSLSFGERLVVFGPNGAGKTTLLRVLGTLLRPSSGEVCIAGLDATRERHRIRQLIGVVGHQPYLYPELTVAENLRYYGRLYRVQDLAGRVEELLERVGLYQRRGDLVASLSRGLVQRLAIARAVLHDPPILLLDEPDTGLDLQAFQLLESLVVGTPAAPRTVVVSTHNLGQGLRLADRVAILVGGRLVHQQPSASLDGQGLEELYRQLLLGAA